MINLTNMLTHLIPLHEILHGIQLDLPKEPLVTHPILFTRLSVQMGIIFQIGEM